jgi:PGF-CTERM protein/uncharacterized repeat protein (TIGR01451 family)
MERKVIKMFAFGLVSILLLCGMLAGALTGVQAQSDEGLVAEWHFDEGSGGVVEDSSGNGNDGVIHGASWVDGKFGKALSFDGRDDYVDCGNDESLDITDEITIEAWVKRSATGVMHIVDRRPTAIELNTELNYDLGFYRDNKLRFYYRNSGDTAWHIWHSTDAYTDTTNWQHFALIFTFGDGSSIKTYRNGQIISGSWIEGNGNDAVVNIDSPVHIGRATYGANPFSGIIDEVRIYDRALTADEIKTLYEGKRAELTLTKAASPHSIKQGQKTTVKITVENTGTTTLRDIEVVDTPSADFDFVSGETSGKYGSLKSGESRTLQYTIESRDTGKFDFDRATATYADEEGNYQTVKSDSPMVEVLSPLEKPEIPTDEEGEKNGMPGFEVVFTIVGLLVVAYLLGRR